jgi:hypothetical protein
MRCRQHGGNTRPGLLVHRIDGSQNDGVAVEVALLDEQQRAGAPAEQLPVRVGKTRAQRVLVNTDDEQIGTPCLHELQDGGAHGSLPDDARAHGNSLVAQRLREALQLDARGANHARLLRHCQGVPALTCRRDTSVENRPDEKNVRIGVLRQSTRMTCRQR